MHLPSDISTLTRLFTKCTTHSLSNRGSNFSAVGIDSQTDSPVTNEGALVYWP